MILAVLALVTASFSPPAPKVGDLITVEFQAPVVLDASRDFEVVSRSGTRVVVRTFEPKPFVLSGIVGGNVRFTNLIVPVGSVLEATDNLQPAPLAPPVRTPYPRAPFVAIGIAALLAIAAWALVVWRAKRVSAVAPLVVIPPQERFRKAVLALRDNGSQPRRWATLADETRVYLAATRPRLGSDLTTSELVPLLPEHDRVVVDILRQGDLEKFSGRGAEPVDFAAVATRALETLVPREAQP